ncbi:MAG: SIMPL domain-containing protein [Bacteroidota bacterium]|jgi:uncharacterized protein YggE
MKCFSLAFLPFIFLGLSRCFSQDVSVHENRMIVYGTGTIDAAADRAKLNFTVRGFGSTLQEAVNIARNKVGDITGQLLSQGIKGANLYTSAFTSGDNFGGKAFLSSSRDYRAQIDVIVTIDSLDMLESVVSTLTKGALEKLSDISFSLKSDSLLKLEARRLAVENAQTKASIMAKQLGVEVGKVLSVEELLSYSDGDFYITDPNRPPGMQAGVVKVGGASFYAQRFNVKSGVRIIFEISNRANGK